MNETAYPCPMCGNDLDGEAVVCAGCATRGRRDLDDLPRLARRLAAMARDSGRAAGEPVSGSRETPLPLKTDQWSFVGPGAPGDVYAPDAGDAACQVGAVPLADVLWTWCRAAADDLDFAVPSVRRNSPVLAVRSFAGKLSAQHDRIMRLTWADDYLDGPDSIHALWSYSRTLAKDWPLVHHLPAPCPNLDCGLLTLRRDDGASHVYCSRRDGGCGWRWTEDDYRRLVLVLTSEVGAR